ncbi:MAG: PLP-dependent transferase [Candidatus Adlerbacteria bacterium]|nr:PLP-dependent transferase [Candidatus Adlerbacteria bacterium]
MERDAYTELEEDKARLVGLFESGIERLARAQERYEEFSHELEELTAAKFSAEIKKTYTEKVRMLYAHMAATLSAPNWQSPSFWHTKSSQAGREEGTISASQNDYKRDMHMQEKEYVQKFVKEYVDHPLRLAPFAYATSSGMSAVTTVLTHLQNKVGIGDTVLAGKSSYFQNKWLLQKLFGTRVRYVDEFDTDGIIRLAKELRPPLVFLDSLCGAESLPMPNLPVLIPVLSKILSNTSTFVLDNTGLGPMYQPLRDLPWNPLGMHVVVVESLLKFHQFGMDRVGGGIIWTPSIVENGLFEARMHMGTIIPDASVSALPEPNRALQEARLMRIGHNAHMLATLLDSFVREHVTVVEKVVHPGLPHYEGYSWTRTMLFQGPFITLRFCEGKRTVSHYDAFVSRVQKIGKEKKVDIIGGTSFGFDTTRLYVTARYATDLTEPFVRIALGTETVDELHALADVFIQAL